jgi:UDP-glucose 4-epimerase
MMEMALQDIAQASDLRAVIFRYFNPIGSDPDLQSGVHVREPSLVLGMAARRVMDAFVITGVDHPTRDGTGAA